MRDFFIKLCRADFMPHGHCYFWDPWILWSHAISDAIIASAYAAIPITLLYIFRKRATVRYVWLMVLFAIFIFGCGMTHVMDVLTIWNPLYRIDSVIRIITALASVGTAVVLVKYTPAIIKIPSGEQWRQMNEDLRIQIQQLKEKDRQIEVFKEFELLTETLPQMVWTSTTDGTVNFYNQKWYLITGLKFEPSLKEMIRSIVHPSQVEEYTELWDEKILSNQFFSMEICVLRHDGTYRWNIAQSNPINFEGKTVWITSLTDIHDQKIQSRELEEKNKMLQIINNDLDNFVYTASHDLRLPINNIEGLIYLLNKDFEKGKIPNKNLLDMMNASVLRLKKTIDELAHVAKIQKDFNTDVEKVRFEEITREVMEDVKEISEKNGAKVTEEWEIEEIRFSRKNLKSVIYNLISNAIKYRSPERNPEILIKTKQEQNYLVLEVSDNGLGIRPQHIKKIFDLFNRGHDHVEGSGVGLYMVKRIVENAGGKVEVESELGLGTKFKLYFYNHDKYGEGK